MPRCIFAVGAGTVLTALFSQRETFTVHLEAEGLLAGAADFTFFGRLGGGVDVGDAVCEEGILLFEKG